MATKTEKESLKPDREKTEGGIIVGPPIPPDGGWGWVVMLASFMISILVDGVCLNIGVLFPYFLDYFQESKGKTSIAGSVLNGTYLLVGPITSALVNKYSCRNVTIAGAVISSIAFFLSTFSPNVDMLITFYGAIAGFGFGLMYLPAIVMVGYYFEAKRAFATGVAVCGSGIGLFLFAPITEHLLHQYSWKGALWIISAIVLHGVIFGAAYRPLPPSITNEDNLNEEKETKGQSIIVPKIIITPAKSDELIVENVVISADKRRPSSGRVMSEECLNKAAQVEQSNHTDSFTWVGRLAKSQDIGALRNVKSGSETYTRALELFQPLNRKDIFYSGSIQNLQHSESSNMPTVGEYSPRHVSTSNGDIVDDKKSKASHICNCFTGLRNMFTDMLDTSLLRSPTAVVYLTACLLVMIGFFVPFAYIPSLALDMGTDGIRAAFLVSILGITNTIGRIISGILSDRSWVDCVLVNNLTLMFCGSITIFVPFLVNYAQLAAYSALFGLSLSPFVSLRSVIIVELFGLEKLTNAFGLVTFSQGVSSYLGAPIAGALADATGNYNVAFYMAGTSLLASGILGLPLRRLARWEQRRKHSNKQEGTAEELSKLT